MQNAYHRQGSHIEEPYSNISLIKTETPTNENHPSHVSTDKWGEYEIIGDLMAVQIAREISPERDVACIYRPTILAQPGQTISVVFNFSHESCYLFDVPYL